MSLASLFLATALATAGVIQQPSSTAPLPSSNAPDDRLATLAPPAPVAVEGCVVTGREVEGASADVGEPPSIDDFVLTAAKVVKGQAPVRAGAVAGPATYGIAGLTDEQLAVHAGRRVRIDGTFGSIDRGTTPADPKDADRLELTATTIRQVPGACLIPKS